MAFSKMYARKNTKLDVNGGTLTESIKENRHTDKMECGLCWEDFKMTDEVFNCAKNHVFHVQCYEDRAEDEYGEDESSGMLNECPTCGSAMNITIE